MRGPLLLAVVVGLLVTVVARDTIWINKSTEVPSHYMALSNQTLVCTGDLEVGLNSDHDGMQASGTIALIGAWNLITANWGAHCEPLGSRKAEKVVVAMTTMMFASGCVGGCHIVDIYRNGTMIDTKYSWLHASQQ